ncbi:hypothetical protein K8Z61_13980 [Nocardioides sp. TRM66260-LWL]|uniref:SCO6745 family protein n=1 Tax=Nocardioides sp. TRM66260-LWL TaxID=2874478 RepID=UPI001CC5E0B2|nr:hypothetical protein [Nocardioides sp. TRM66260-LWL]MBZ5735602.1 hypothetical protein [Nocardioides sp. TRM66260-LWL]
MDYSEAQAAFFAPREGTTRTIGWRSPARDLRDAIEPIATISFWAEPAYDAYAALGLDFLQGYVHSRSRGLGDVEPAVAAAAFGVFEPGLIAGVLAEARGVASVAAVRAAAEEGAIASLRAALPRVDEAEVARVAAVLRRGADAAPTTGRALHAGLASLAYPDDPFGVLWHAATLLREHRGDGHLAALVAAGVDGVAANLLTELWVGWDPFTYSASRAWAPETLEAAATDLTGRGWLADGRLTDAGLAVREDLEAATDRSVALAVAALADDLGTILEPLHAWGEAVTARGWFPPDPYKRAAG